METEITKVGNDLKSLKGTFKNRHITKNKVKTSKDLQNFLGIDWV